MLPNALAASMTPGEIREWLLLGGGIGVIIVLVIKFIEWFLKRFPTRKEFEDLRAALQATEERLRTLEHTSITDAARQIKQIEIMNEYVKVRNRER